MTTYRTFESHVDLNQNVCYWQGEGDTYNVASRGELFRDLRSIFGKCVSKMYRETKTRDGVKVGWVFHKRIVNDDYLDRPYTYVREVWVEVREVTEEKEE